MAHGKICYLEIPASDVQASAEFYAAESAAVYDWFVARDAAGLSPPPVV